MLATLVVMADARDHAALQQLVWPPGHALRLLLGLGVVITLLAAGVLLGRHRVRLQVEARTEPLQQELDARAREQAELRRTVHEREEQRRATHEAQRTAMLGALVSTLAHELNNPNHTIMLNVPVLRAAWQDAVAVLDQHAAHHAGMRLANIPYADMRDDVPRLIEEIHRGADRIRGIVASLRNHTRGAWQHDVRAVDLGAVLAEAVAAARPLLEAVTDAFAVEVTHPLPAVRGNRMLLLQTFVGLLTHAAHAITDRAQAVALTAMADASEVTVKVSDRGRGVPQGEVPYLTKPFQHPTGSLELAMAVWIVQQHGGSVSIASEVATGTSVTVTLSRSMGGLSAASGGARVQRSGTERA